MNPDAVLQLDRVIHEKGRLAIMALLAASPALLYTELRDTLKMTDGNVTAHLRTLLEAGYVAVTKSFEGGRPATSYSLTPTGRTAFADYVRLLEQVVRDVRPKKS